MKINYRESQLDFLAQPAGESLAPAPARYMAAQISLSLENLVILTIAIIMLGILLFSMGIERGKKIALAPALMHDGAPVSMTVAAPLPAAVKDEKLSDKVRAKAAPVVDVQKTQVTSAKESTGSGFTLQVASYKGEKFARREADQLKKKGFNDVYVLPKGAYTIVCVGNFQEKAGASDVKRQLKGRYQDFVVRRL